MTDYPGTAVVITSDEDLLHATQSACESTDAQVVEPILQSIVSYVQANSVKKASTLEDDDRLRERLHQANEATIIHALTRALKRIRG